MKFGDIVTAVASLIVIVGLTMLPLYVVLAPTLGVLWGGMVVGVISTLVSSVIVGYIFAGKMLDGRREAIAKIAVLSAALVMVSVMCLIAAVPDWGPHLNDVFQEMYPEAANWSISEWVAAEITLVYLDMFLNAVITFVVGFVGLYVGSMLRKPSKS